jgi:hypothetical protein
LNLSCILGSVLESMLLMDPSKNLFQQTVRALLDLSDGLVEKYCPIDSNDAEVHSGIELRGRGPARERAAAFQHVGQILLLIFGNIA